MKTQFHTFGCKVNTYDTSLLEKKIGETSSREEVHVLNTCAVTAEATKDAVRLTRKLKRKNPKSLVVVTGCSAQIDTKDFDIDSVDLVIGNSHKEEIQNIIDDALNKRSQEKFYHKNIFRKHSPGEGGGIETEHSRVFFKIQDGCNSFCSFCVIPHTRGLSRSIDADKIVSRIKEFVLNGYKEVVITGIHLGDYKDDKNRILEDLIEKILEETTLPRLRLTSLEPIEISKRLLDLFDNKRLCPHFHISVQSVNTKILTAMKRKYSREETLDSFKKVKEKIPHGFIGMDVIVGFPGETKEDFNITYESLKNSPYWDKIHVFPYSERPKTGATLIKEDIVPLMERKRRSKLLRELSQSRINKRAKEMIGSELEVLVLNTSKKEGWLKTLSDNYWPVTVAENLDQNKSKIKRVRLVDFDSSFGREGSFVGEFVNQ